MTACLALFLLGGFAGVANAEKASRLVTARDLAVLRDISGLSVSPDGRWVAFAIIQADPERNRYNSSWNALELATRRVRVLADAGEIRPDIYQGDILQYLPPSAPAWSPDGAAFVYLRYADESAQIWRVHVLDGEAEQLTRNDASIRRVVYSRDSRRLLFETEPSQKQVAAALAVEGRRGFRFDERFRPLASRTPSYPRDTDLRSFFQYAPSQVAARSIWVYEFGGKRERPASTAEEAEFEALTAPPRSYNYLGGASAASTAGRVAWTEARDPERRGYQPPRTIIAQTSGASAPIVCEAPECTTVFFDGLWWRDEDELLFVRREGLRMQDRGLYAWRPGAEARPRLIMRTPDLFGAATGCGLAQDRLICLYEKSNYPARIAAIDLKSGATEFLHDPNPGFGAFRLGPPPKRLAIRAQSGVETYGYLIQPPDHRGEGRLPLVIVTYRCGGFLRGGTGDEYPIFPFAAAGFAVLCFDAPDDHERQARMDAASYTNWNRGPGNPSKVRVLEGLAAAITQLDRMGVIDPNRIGITGLSYGAEIVGWAMPDLTPKPTAAISSGDPGPSPSIYPLIAPLVRERRRDWGIGSPEETPDAWHEQSFTPHVERILAPLLMNVSDSEMLTATAALVALEDAGRAVEMYVFPKEYHIKSQPAHRIAIYNRNIDWMRFWLQGHEDSAPEKVEQYQRWQDMRAKRQAVD